MNNKYNHKKFVNIWRIVVSIILALDLLSPIIIGIRNNISTLRIEEHSASSEYYEYSNETYVVLQVFYNYDCDNTTITIECFDSLNKSLGKYSATGYETDFAYSEFLFSNIKGNAKSYEIVEYGGDPDFSTDIVWAIIFFPIIVIFFICSLLLNYKEYNIGGNRVQIYAGWSHHQLVINGNLVDEHVALFNFTPITLETNYNETYYNVVISTSNRIRFKVNGNLIH